MLKFGFGMGRELPIGDIAPHAALADSLGADHVTFIDSQALSRDSVAMMTIAALNTDNVRIGQGVTQPYTRHPTVLANAVATIDELSNGRAFLGIGAGGSATGVIGLEPRPLKDLKDTVEFFHSFVTGAQTTYGSGLFSARSEWSRRSIPVILGVDGPKSMKQSVGLASGVMAPGLHPAIVNWRTESLRNSGANLDEFEYWVRTMVCVDEDEEDARGQVASYAATCAFQFYFSVLRWDSPDAARMRDSLPPSIIDAVEKLGREYDWYQHERRDANHAKSLPDELIEAWVMFGSPQKIAEQINALRAMGVSRISMTLYTIRDKMLAMERFAREVLPLVV